MPDVHIQKIGDLQRDVDDIFEKFPIPLRGRKVLIKPNMLSASPPEKGVTTSPALVTAIVRRVERETDDIIVGDNPGGNKVDVESIAEKSGIKDASCGYFRVLSNPRPIPVRSRFVDNLVVSAEVLDADVIINVPRAKTHALTRITCCIKNMFGIVPGGIKPRLHTLAPSYEQFSELMVDIYAIRPPHLNIVDATTIMGGTGPSNGYLVEYGRLVSGSNGVCVDAVVSHIMGITPSSVAMLAIAGKRGLGSIDTKNIAIEGELRPIERLAVPSKATSSLLSHVNPFYGFIIEKPFIRNETCDKCLECVDVCPTGAMKNVDGVPRLEREECTSCFCCLEMCRYDAIAIARGKTSFISKVEKAVLKRI